jgi:hypothetical protein
LNLDILSYLEKNRKNSELQMPLVFVHLRLERARRSESDAERLRNGKRRNV